MHPGETATVHVELFTGRLRVLSGREPEPVRGNIETDWLSLSFEGETARGVFQGNSSEELHDILSLLAFGLPPLLGVHFGEPVVASDVSGRLGSEDFVWGLAVATPQLIVSDQADREARLEAALGDFAWVSQHPNPRLIVALNYFQSAIRLLHVGVSIYEFLGEAVLNYARMLQALFGESRDAIRAGLKTLGLSEEQIERRFIPMLILRSHFDSGHVMMAGMTPRERTVLSRYVEDAQGSFLELMLDVLSAVQEGKLELPEYNSGRLDRERRSVIESMEHTAHKWTSGDASG